MDPVASKIFMDCMYLQRPSLALQTRTLFQQLQLQILHLTPLNAQDVVFSPLQKYGDPHLEVSCGREIEVEKSLTPEIAYA